MRRSIAALVVCAAGAVGATACSHPPQPPQSSAVAHEPASAPKQTVLPFIGLERPDDVEVDSAGNVYLTDITPGGDGFTSTTNRVIELAAGSKTQKTLPFTRSTLIAAPSGAVWVIDGGQRHSHLVKLAPMSDQQTVLPMPDIGIRGQVLALDNAGNVYGVTGGGEVAGGGCCVPIHVEKDAPGSNTPEVLPFQYVDGLGGMATDTAGNLYVGDASFKRVLKLAPGATSPTELPFTGLQRVVDIAVDPAGDVYVVDAQRNQVLKLSAGTDKTTVLPFDALNHPVSVAVDNVGDVYVVDGGNHRVVQLEGV
jgi:streptogramin lyase